MIKLTSDKRMLEYDKFLPYSNIFCFSTTRYGGVSEGSYSSFNSNEFCGDNLCNVIKNREILCKLLPQIPEQLIIPHQTHGVKVLDIDDAFIKCNENERKELLEGVDALVTTKPSYCLCVSTADCIPVLLFDKINNVVAAVHAGWRGTVNMIVCNALEVMMKKYGTDPSNLIACIGPGISQKAFEVGDEVYDEFCKISVNMHEIASRNEETGKWHINLWEANYMQLVHKGVSAENIEISGICTYYNNDIFFSARRQGINSGRILTGIMILKDFNDEI